MVIRGKRLAMVSAACAALVVLSGCSSVVARVNKQDISRDAYVNELERAAGVDVMRSMIIRSLVLERAKADDCLPTDAQVTERFNQIKQDNFDGDETKFREWMKSTSEDDKSIQDQIEMDLAITNLRAKGLDTSDAKLKAFFDENRQQLFDKPARVSFRQIIVPTAELAKQVISEANSSNQLFQDLVTKYSQDASKANGGLAEEVDPTTIRGEGLADLRNAVEKGQVNQVWQQPISLNGGQAYAVIRVSARHAAEKADFTKIKDRVKDAYIGTNGKPAETIIAEAARNADVVVFERRLKEPIEKMFSNGGEGALPTNVQQNLNPEPEMTGPTRVDELPAPATGAAPAAPPAEGSGR